eukprot:TRINITY_DN5877_c1_g3_i1.p1 TRINITY_DN5877_c1_g3~~TRINITY_DN5877_c1_g3_i1.p1  ORF type:complete len:182 (+),score=10.99 TRINITY_DN5877_c1_g3_i1:262-807(+)
MYNYQTDNPLPYPSQSSSAPPPYNPSAFQYPPPSTSQPPVASHITLPQTYAKYHEDALPREEDRQFTNYPQRRDRAREVSEIIDFEPVVVGPCLWVLIIAGIFCCCILGVFALLFATLACFKEYSGRIGTAVRLAKAARVLAILSIMIGMIIITVNLLLEFTVPQDYTKYLWDGWNQGEKQ